MDLFVTMKEEMLAFWGVRSGEKALKEDKKTRYFSLVKSAEGKQQKGKKKKQELVHRGLF